MAPAESTIKDWIQFYGWRERVDAEFRLEHGKALVYESEKQSLVNYGLPDFTAAGGHFNPTDASHGDHAGDLPTLLVNEDGTGMLAAATDRFSLADLRDADGSAVIVHELPDNYANIPDRYTPPADEETLSTGDAGSRLACGELR